VPTSDYTHIPEVLQVVTQCKPKSVLDVGVGYGKWGVLLREVLEVYESRYASKEWITQIDGIEAHEPYRNALWAATYNQVCIGDAFTLLDQAGHYDLILCGDVIEHFEKAQGMVLLEKMLAKGSVVVVTSPRIFIPQGAEYENSYEVHRSLWSEADFKMPHVFMEIGLTFMAVLSHDRKAIERLNLRSPLERLGARRASVGFAHLLLQRCKARLTGK
jgi:Methyltransferase domain